MHNYSIKEIQKLDDFEKLKTIWDSFAEKQVEYGYFLNHDWFKLWFEHFLKNNRLHILLLSEANQVVAIAPFFRIKEKYKIFYTSKILLIGNAYSPIRNILFNESNYILKKDYLKYILNYLMSEPNVWDIMELYPLKEDDEEYMILKDVIKEQGYFNDEENYAENRFDNNFPCSFDEYLKQRSKQFRKQLRRLRNKLEQLGEIEIKIVKDACDIDEGMNAYYEVYSKSWKKREEIGPTFHRDLAKMAAQSDNLRLGLLFLNNRPIATEYCVIYKKRAHFLKSAYDEEYSFYSPGNIIYYEMIKYLIENDGVRGIDLGYGNEEYKKSLASQKRNLKKLIIFRKNMKGYFIAMLVIKLFPILNRYSIINKIKKNKVFKYITG
jgi:predicted N-acyltransferase